MWIKHVVSIKDLVDDLEYGDMAMREEWDEKIGDAINYLFLLNGLVVERLDCVKNSADVLPGFIEHLNSPGINLAHPESCPFCSKVLQGDLEK